MGRVEYSTTGGLRTKTPRIETTFGTMAYWQSLQFAEHGRLSLGGFEPPYDGQPGAEKTVTVNRVEYSGSIGVYVNRAGEITLDFSSFHPKGDWRGAVTDSARRKLTEEILPLAVQFFPMPTRENIAAAIYRDSNSSAYSRASRAVHELSSEVYRDARYAGYADDIRAGVLAGLDRAKVDAVAETFHTSSTAS